MIGGDGSRVRLRVEAALRADPRLARCVRCGEPPRIDVEEVDGPGGVRASAELRVRLTGLDGPACGGDGCGAGRPTAAGSRALARRPRADLVRLVRATSLD
ncbi:hypothetical protein [Streptomyces sp. NPDC060194]|uniref:hypothetical protein n=1 Tax=Streptomyces sp. NPDC060194 TaxID=3347069 RepID=UPI0036688927